MFPPRVQVVSENSVLQRAWYQAVTPDDTSPFVDPAGHPHRDRPPACEPPARRRPAVCVPRSMVTGLNVTFGGQKSCWQRRDFCRPEGRRAKPPAAFCGPRSRPYAFVGNSFLGVTGLLVCHRWLWMVIASTLADNVLAGMWLNCFLSELYL